MWRRLVSPPLEDVGWMTEEATDALREVGLLSLLDLTLTPLDLLLKCGFDRKEAVRLTEKANEEIGYARRGIGLIGQGMRRRRIPTGSASLDRLLGGGFSAGRVTELYGESGSGKTQLCFQLCVNAQIQPDYEGDTVYIDTGGTFRPERIAEMATGRIGEDELFRRILLVNARTSAEQIRIASSRHGSASARSIGMLVIDTLTDSFVYEFQGDKHISDRQSALARHLHDLAMMALDLDIPVVVTNTVRTRMLDDGEGWLVETGGVTVEHGVHVRVRLDRVVGGWIARRGGVGSGVRFKIEKNGIMDWEE